MEKIFSYLKKIYRQVVYSIGFYPFLISAAFFFLAWLSLYAEDFEIVSDFKEKVPHLIIQDRETARVILATLVGSILSLTVFSFTMVMVVLNQASSNFSPRLLPGLISDKGHQMILGVYIGTLTFCMIILISLGAYGVDSTSFGLSTMIAASLGVLCVGLFVSFINSISKAIQIHNIIGRITDFSLKKLEHQSKLKSYDDNDESKLPNTKELNTDRTGYFRGFDVALIEETLKDKDILVEILAYKDQHVWKDDAILKYTGSLSDEELNALQARIDISSNHHESNSSTGGMVQLMEVAVKAMSPGINDPGTAKIVISKLGILMNKALEIPGKVLLTDKDCSVRVVGRNISGETLMRMVIQPIRLYSKKDVSVLGELIQALKFLERNQKILPEIRKAVTDELKALQHDLEINIDNEMDKSHLLTLLDY